MGSGDFYYIGFKHGFPSFFSLNVTLSHLHEKNFGKTMLKFPLWSRGFPLVTNGNAFCTKFTQNPYVTEVI